MGRLIMVWMLPPAQIERLDEIFLQHRSQDQRQDQRGHVKFKLSQDIPHAPHDDEDINVEQAVIHAEGAHQTKQGNKAHEDMLGYAEDTGEHSDEGKVKDEKDYVSDIHAGHYPPENVRALNHEERAGLYPVDDQGSQKHGRHRGKGHSQSQEGHHESGSGTVVGGFRPGYPFDGSLAKFFGMFRD